jgi:hypothetical protein
VFNCLSKYGFTDDNTLFADSTCPDEINHADPDQDITALFAKRWGELFPLGGLAGLPFTGKTGWTAFSSHCPIDGHILILFAPHVGIDFEGKVGSYYRPGQTHGSRACGAAIGAYLANIDNPDKGQHFENGYLDHQMDCIKHLISPHCKGIKNSKNEMATLAYRMYEIHRDFLDQILHYKWMHPTSKLAILGGIQINTDGQKNDQFLPLSFEVRCKGGNNVIDMYEKCFGRKSPYLDFVDANNEHSTASGSS